MPKKEQYQVSDEDKKILAELQKHSIKDIDSVAQHCGVSKQKIWKTIKKFEQQKIIWGYTTVVDEKKQNLEKFILLLKKTNVPITEKIIDTITQNPVEALSLDFSVTIESSHYLHGDYDWVIIFTAKDLRHAKKFSNMLLMLYSGIVAKIDLLQIMYSQRLHYVVNPDIKKLKEFM